MRRTRTLCIFCMICALACICATGFASDIPSMEDTAPHVHEEDADIIDIHDTDGAAPAESQEDTGTVLLALTSEPVAISSDLFTPSAYDGPPSRSICFCCKHCSQCYNANGTRKSSTCACYKTVSGADIYMGCQCTVGACDCHFVDGPEGEGQLVYGAMHYRRLLATNPSGNWGTSRVVYLGCLDNMTDVQKRHAYDLDAIAGVPQHYDGDRALFIPKTVTNLLICGRDPVNQAQLVYKAGKTYVRPDAVVTRLNYAMTDLDAVTTSMHGLLCGATGDDVVISFTDVRCRGVEMCHNEGAKTTTIFEDCDVTLDDSQGRASMRWGHCQDVIVQGGTTTVRKMESNDSNWGKEIFTFTSFAVGECTMTIRSGANLVIESPLNDVSFIEVASSKAQTNLIVEENAKLTVDMPGRFCSTQMNTIRIDKGAQVVSNPDIEQLGSAGAYIPVKDLIVDGTLIANYYREQSSSTNDICVKAVSSMTIGESGRVRIEQHGGVGSAIYANGFSSHGKVNVHYNPLDKAAANQTSSALNIGSSLLEVFPGGELNIQHVRGRGTCIETLGIIVHEAGLIDLVHTPSGNLSGIGSPTIKCSGDVSLHAGGLMKVVQDRHQGTAYGGHAINITSSSATVDVSGTLDVLQRSGTDTIANPGGTLTCTGDGIFGISKEDAALGSVLKAKVIHIKNRLSLTQNAGESAIDASELYVEGSNHLLDVKKTGGTGAILSGGNYGSATLSATNGATLTFEQTGGAGMLQSIGDFNVSESTVTLRQDVGAAEPVIAFTGGAASGLHLDMPTHLVIENTNGPLIAAAGSGGIDGTTSVLAYTAGGTTDVYSPNLLAERTMTLSAKTASGQMASVTNSLENGAGAKPGQRPMTTISFNLLDPSFSRLESGTMERVLANPHARGTDTVTASADANCLYKAMEYAMPGDTYEHQNNESAQVRGNQSLTLTLPRPTQTRYLCRIYMEAAHDIGLTGYGYLDAGDAVGLAADDLLFQPTSVSNTMEILPRQDTRWAIRVYDGRAYEQNGQWKGQPWALQVTVQDLFRDVLDAQKTLPASRLLFKATEGEAGTLLNPGISVAIASGSSQQAGYEDVAWTNPRTGLLFQQQASEGEADATYSTHMMWSLIIT